MEQLLISSSQKEKELPMCHNPVRQSVPHLLSEQKYSNQLITLPNKDTTTKMMAIFCHHYYKSIYTVKDIFVILLNLGLLLSFMFLF